jgi:hypothetical protein
MRTDSRLLLPTTNRSNVTLLSGPKLTPRPWLPPGGGAGNSLRGRPCLSTPPPASPGAEGDGHRAAEILLPTSVRSRRTCPRSIPRKITDRRERQQVLQSTMARSCPARCGRCARSWSGSPRMRLHVARSTPSFPIDVAGLPQRRDPERWNAIVDKSTDRGPAPPPAPSATDQTPEPAEDRGGRDGCSCTGRGQAVQNGPRFRVLCAIGQLLTRSVHNG